METALAPVSPGELLLEEFLRPMGITMYRLAKEINVPATRIGEIVAGRRSITADTDLRLCRFFSLSDGYWLRAQAAFDTEVAHAKLADELEKIHPWAERQDGNIAGPAWVLVAACGHRCLGDARERRAVLTPPLPAPILLNHARE